MANPTAPTASATAAAAATMAQVTAGAAAADQKSAAAGAPGALPVTALTAAAAAQVLDPKIAYSKALSLAPVIAQSFCVYDPTLPKDAYKCLSVAKIIQIAQLLFVILPAKARPDLALAAYQDLSSQLFKAKTPEESAKLFTAMYTQFWGSCQQELTPSLKFVMKNTFDLAVSLTDTVPGPIASIDPAKQIAMRQMILRLMKDTYVFLEEVWKKADQEIAAFTKLYNDSQGKKSRIHANENFKPISFGTADSCYNIITRLFPRLKYYTSRKVVAIGSQISRLDIRSHDVSSTVRALTRVAQVAKKHVIDIVTELGTALGTYEGVTCFTNGFFPKSQGGEQHQQHLYDCTCIGTIKFRDIVNNNMLDFVDSHPRDRKLLKTVSKEKFLLFLQQISKAICCESNEREIQKSKQRMGEVLSSILDPILTEIAVEHKAISSAFYPIFMCETVTDRYIKGQRPQWAKFYSEQFLDAALEVTGLQFPNSLVEILRSFGMALQESIKLNELQGRFKRVQAEQVSLLVQKRPAGFPEADCQQAIEMTANAWKIVHSIGDSFLFLDHLFKALQYVQDEIDKVRDQAQAVVADEHLGLLLLEENAEAERIASEQEQKQKPAKPDASSAAAAAAAPAAVELVVVPPTAPPRAVLPASFNVPYLQTLFEMRCAAAEFYKMNPATVVSPYSFAGNMQPLSKLAELQHIYAFDGFLIASEMLLRSNNPVLAGLVLQRGHLALEQCLTVEHAAKFPKSYLQHELQQLLGNLGIRLDANMWAQHASGYSLYCRYPHSFKGLSKALEHPQLLQAMPQWLTGLAEMQSAALTHLDPKNATLGKVQTVVAGLANALKKPVPEMDQKVVGALSETQTQALKECEKKLTTCLEPLQKIADDTKGSKALMNARHHLNQLLETVRILPQFPQQRYLHACTHLLISAIKNFAENFGTYLTFQNGAPMYTHKLRDLPLKDLLKDGKLLMLLEQIDIGKGDEYPFDYFAYHGASASPIMQRFSDLYALSQEAILLGEGAKPYGLKSTDLLQGELVEMAVDFTNLACALLKGQKTS